MSRVTKGIRAKRFFVKSTHEVLLTIESETGEHATLRVRNGSLTGLAATVNLEDWNRLGIEMGKIIPESKICWKEHEVSLGRLVARNRRESPEGLVIGFSCVDTKVPVMGGLAQCFEVPQMTEETALQYELGSKKFNLSSFIEADHSHPDLFQKCHEYWLLKEDVEKNPFWQFYGIRHQVENQNVTLSLPKIRKPTPYVSFASYDYFGFSTDPEVKEAAIQATNKYGVSATATPPLSGRTALHVELEQKIAQMLRKEDAILFNSGFAANVGTLTAVLGANDFAVADLLSHASIHDGLSASKCKLRLFRHNNNRHLHTVLNEHREDHAGTLVVSEGLFSMDGDVPNLKEFIRIGREFNARILLDEVHSFGVLGPTGLGAAERFGVLDDIDIYTGSLSKGMGAGGGFVAGTRELVAWLRVFARAGMFSSAVSPGCVGAALKSLSILRSDENRRQKLLGNISLFLEGLKDLGYKPISDPQSPIIPVVIGDTDKLGIMNGVMLEHGVFVNTIVFPAVALNASRFRFSMSAGHSASDIRLALVALKAALRAAKIDLSERIEMAA